MDYIPFKDSDKILWNENLNGKIDTQGALLGLEAADIATLKSVTAANAAAIKASNDAQVAAKTANAAKLSQLSTGNKIIRSIVRKMKSSSTYTPSIGKNLDIIGDEATTIDIKSYKPEIKVRVLPGKVRISFVKKSLEGINVYSRLKGQTAWQKLGFVSYSPYEDTRPLAESFTPEHREFLAIGVIRDQEVTLKSNIVEAVFGG